MAQAPSKTLEFRPRPEGAPPGCDECGERRVNLPAALSAVADDFDWLVRDYDSFRLFLMEELAHRFPERQRWTPADVEVVIVELLASQMDRLSHALDVVQAERFLTTARRPESVRRHLALIGYDAVARTPEAAYDRLPPLPAGQTETATERLERLWALVPGRMEQARADGPRRIGEQERMVTLADHAARLMRHPFCERAQARLVWTGAWSTILVSVLLDGAALLDDALHNAGLPAAGAGRPNLISAPLWDAVIAWHEAEGLPLPQVTPALTRRQILRIVVDRYRMIGAEVFLEDALQVPITFWLSVKIRPGYFRSEIRDGLAQVLSTEPGGLFEPGRLGFGEDVHASNIIEVAMALDGVETACLNRFKQLGTMWADRTDAGVIEIAPDEVAICQNAPGAPHLGGFEITVLGGETG